MSVGFPTKIVNVLVPLIPIVDGVNDSVTVSGGIKADPIKSISWSSTGEPTPTSNLTTIESTLAKLKPTPVIIKRLKGNPMLLDILAMSVRAPVSKVAVAPPEVIVMLAMKESASVLTMRIRMPLLAPASVKSNPPNPPPPVPE